MQEEPNYYSIIPATVRYNKNLTANAKLLYGEITALTNKKGYCWATNNYFANLYEVSKVSISKWINSLVVEGYITSEIVYKDNTKQIDKRLIRINEICNSENNNFNSNKENLNRYTQNLNTPKKENFNTTNKEKFKDNNIYINNTSNNITLEKKGFCDVSKDLSLDNAISNKKNTKNKKIKNYEKYLECLICNYDENTISNKVIELLKDFYSWRSSINKNPSKVEIEKNLMDLARYDEKSQIKWLEKTMLNSWVHLNPEYMSKELSSKDKTTNSNNNSTISNKINEFISKYGSDVAIWLTHYDLVAERIDKYGSLDKFYDYIIPKLDGELKINGKIDIENLMSQ